MSVFLKEGKKTLNARETQIVRVLTKLKDGEPIESYDDFGILKYPVELNTLVGDWVISSRESGCSCAASAFWFQAPRGGGKTEALRYVQRSLVDQEHTQGFGKSLVVPINLLEGSGRHPMELQVSIFRDALLTKTSALHATLREAEVRLIEGGGFTDPAVARGTSIALDVLSAIAGASLPGVGALVGEGIIPWLRRTTRLRRGNIEKILKTTGLGNPEALNLLIGWIDFSIHPNKKRYDAFYTLAREAARRHELFHLFCLTLEQAGYSAIVLLVDEVDTLIENDAMVGAFEALWNRPAAGADFEHNLDIGFVMAISANQNLLMNEERYGGFVRRFFGPSENRRGLVMTPRPVVSEDDSDTDDLAQAIRLFRNLLSQVTHGIRTTPSLGAISSLRAKLYGRSNDHALTWHGLWASVAELFVIVDAP